MRIVTPPYMQSVLEADDIIGALKLKPPLLPRKELFKCPRCINGVCKEGIDGKFIVLTCINCGWSREKERNANQLVFERDYNAQTV